MELSIRMSHTFEDLPEVIAAPLSPYEEGKHSAMLEKRKTFLSRATALPGSGYSSQWFVVIVVAYSLMCDFLLFTIIIPIMPAVLLAIDPAQATETYIGVLFASKALVGFIAGPLLSSVPPWLGMMVGIMINIASAVGFGVFESYYLFFAARAFSGIGSALLMGGGMTLIMLCHEEDDRASAGGYAMTGLTIGALSGPFIGGLVYTASKGSQIAPFALVIVVMMINLAMVTVLKPLVLSGGGGGGGGGGGKSGAGATGAGAADADEEADDAPPAPTAVSFSTLLRDSLVITAAVAMGLQWFVIGSLEAIAPAYLQEHFGLGVFVSSLIWSVCPVSHFLNNFASAALASRLPYWVLVIAGEIATLGGMVLMHLSGAGTSMTHLAVEVAGLFCIGVGMAYVVGAPLQGITSKLASARGYPDIGQLVAISNSGQQLGLIVGPMLGAPVYQYVGPGAYYLGTAAAFGAFTFANCRFAQLDRVADVDPAAKRAAALAQAAAEKVQPVADKAVDSVLRITAAQLAKSKAEAKAQRAQLL